MDDINNPNGMLQANQVRQVEIHVEQEMHEEQENAVPRQLDQQLQQQQNAFPQPAEHIEPAVEEIPPVQVQQQAQQQQLGRKERLNQARAERKRLKQLEKERKKQEKEQKKAAKKFAKEKAKAKLEMDAIEKKLRTMKVPEDASRDLKAATDYELWAPTEAFEDRAVYLQRAIFKYISDPVVAQEMFEEMEAFTQKSKSFDEYSHEKRFRFNAIPQYIEGVEHKEMSEAMKAQLNAEMDQFSNDNFIGQMTKQYIELEKKLLSHLTDEQKKDIRSKSMLEGAEAQAYENEIEQIMQQKQVTIEEARSIYGQQKISEKMSPTLRGFEESRHRRIQAFRQREIEEPDREYYIEYANQDLKKMYPGMKPLTWGDADRMVTDMLRDFMKTNNTSYQIRVPNCDIMSRIIDSGRFKTQMETNSSGALLNQDIRKKFTQDTYGTSPELPAEQYEVYGYMSHGDMVREADLANKDNIVGQGVGQYGQVIVKLKKDAMRNRVTTTLGDSLSGFNDSHCSDVDMPDLMSVGAKHRSDLIVEAYKYNMKKQNGENPPAPDLNQILQFSAAPYMELQYHGQVTIDDIESITLLSDFQKNEKNKFNTDTDIPADLVQKLKEKGIKATYVKGGKEYEC